MNITAVGSGYVGLVSGACLSEWRVFRASNLDKIKAEMRGDVIVDGRNIFSPEAVTEAGLTYYGIGR